MSVNSVCTVHLGRDIDKDRYQIDYLQHFPLIRLDNNLQVDNTEKKKSKNQHHHQKVLFIFLFTTTNLNNHEKRFFIF